MRSGFDRICGPVSRTQHAPRTTAALSPAVLRSAADRLKARGFSQDAIDIAEIIGALPLLEQLLTAEMKTARGHGMAAALRLLHLRLAISNRIQLAMLDVSSTLAVIDCEGEGGDALRVRLEAAAGPGQHPGRRHHGSPDGWVVLGGAPRRVGTSPGSSVVRPRPPCTDTQWAVPDARRRQHWPAHPRGHKAAAAGTTQTRPARG